MTPRCRSSLYERSVSEYIFSQPSIVGKSVYFLGTQFMRQPEFRLAFSQLEKLSMFGNVFDAFIRTT